MTYLDLVLLRIVLASLLSSIMLSGFLLIRLVWSKRPGGCLRRRTWLLIMTCAFLIFPWPAIVKVPANSPEWVYSWRLPDPAVPVLDQNIIDQAIIAARNSENAGNTLPISGDIQYLSSRFKTPDQYIPESGFKNWLLGILPVWRMTYLIGLILFCLVHLIMGANLIYQRYIMLKSAEKQKKITRHNLDQEAWQQKIAVMRDKTRLYRHADVVLSDTDPEDPLTLFRNWKKHFLAVSSDHPQNMTPTRCENMLLLSLDRSCHPDVAIRLLFYAVRCLQWFNPFWWFTQPFLLSDIRLARQARMKKRTLRYATEILPSGKSNKAKSNIKNAIWILFLAIILIISYWQLPRMLLPDIAVAIKNTDYGLIINESSSISPNLFADQLLIDEQHLAVQKGERFYAVSFNQEGQVVWQADILDLLAQEFDIKEIQYFTISDSCRLADGRWTAAAAAVTEKGDHNLYLQLSSAGKLIRLQNIQAPTMQTENYYVSNQYVILLNDGGWLLSSIILISNEAGSYQYQLNRFSANGQLLWQKTAMDSQWANLQLGTYGQPGVNHVRQIGQIVPLSDLGFYLIVNDTIYLESNKDAHPIIHEQSDQLIRFSQDGQVIWSKRVSGSEIIFKTMQAEADAENRLYLAGFETWRLPEKLLGSVFTQTDSDSGLISRKSVSFFKEQFQQAKIMAFRADGSSNWEQSFYGLSGSFCQSMLIQPESQTIMVTSYDQLLPEVTKIKSTHTLIQMNDLGLISGRLVVPEINWRDNQSILFVQNGKISMPEHIK